MALMAVAACDVMPTGGPADAPSPAEVAPPPPSAQSLALREHYRRVERDLRAQGLLRTDGGGRDAPFTASMLAENFVRIALFDEYVNVGGRLVARTSESRLRRWERPIRMNVVFGESVPEERRAKDRRDIASYTQRLARLTGVPIRQTAEDANFLVLILNEDERRASAQTLRDFVPGISEAALSTITAMPKSTFCLVFAFSEDRTDSYTRAVAVIRDEHPAALRLSCIHEEIAQSMGLANDSPTARPSIFNDDEEFALLTRQDELMLRILYDRRLKPGMTASQARPIVTQIANELVGGES